MLKKHSVFNRGVKDLSDIDLFEKLCRHDDLSAFRELFDRYWLKLYAAAKSRLQNEDEAKDCVQDIFFNIWSKRSTLPVPDWHNRHIWHINYLSFFLE